MRRSMLYVALFLILAGLTILVKDLFGLRFGTFSVLFAEAVILLGLYLITGGRSQESGWEGSSGPSMRAHGREQSVFFSSSTLYGSPETAKYTVAFSSVTLELPDDIPEIVEVTCVFSDVHVLLPKGRAVRVKISSAFGNASMPGGGVSGFGVREALIGEGLASYLSADSVFGSIRVS